MTYNMQRLRYFNGQFLIEDDFTDHETYHIDQRELHGRAQHVWGIVEGLTVTRKPGDLKTLVVAAGVAVDGVGHQILLDAPQEIQPPVPLVNQAYFLIIAWKEIATDPAPIQYAPGMTRWTQTPILAFETSVDPGDVVIAQVTVDTGGDVTSLTATTRTYSGVRLPGNGGKGFDLRSLPDGEDASKLSVEHFTPADAAFQPLVTVSDLGNVGIGEQGPVQKLVVTAGKVGIGYNTLAQTAALAVSGNVGIGTVTPGTALEVVGQVRITGGAPAQDKVLVSDTVGTGTWKFVDTPNLVDGSVTANKLATNAVTTVKIVDLNVTNGKIADGAVNANKLASNAVTTIKIADDNVTPAKIQGGPTNYVLTTTSPGVVSWDTTSRTRSILISPSQFDAISFYEGAAFGTTPGYVVPYLVFPNNGQNPTCSLFLPTAVEAASHVAITLYYSLPAVGTSAYLIVCSGTQAIGSIPNSPSGPALAFPAHGSTPGGVMATDIFASPPQAGAMLLLMQRVTSNAQDTGGELRVYGLRITYTD